MKINKIKAMFPAVVFLFAASFISCTKDLDKGNIDPNVEENPDRDGLYAKCYAGLIMEGNDGKPTSALTMQVSQPCYVTYLTSTVCPPMKPYAGGVTVVL